MNVLVVALQCLVPKSRRKQPGLQIAPNFSSLEVPGHLYGSFLIHLLHSFSLINLINVC